MSITRCEWPFGDELMLEYHDKEWGVPLHDEKLLFEAIILDGAQAGLSWRTILKRREGYRRAYDGFDPERVAGYGPGDIERLLSDSGIIRNKLKVASSITNAESFVKIQDEFGSFDAYLWGFFEEAPKKNHFKTLSELPATTPESDALSRDLKSRGFKFMGPTICYAFMQAVGIVNDHVVDCYRWGEL